MVVSHTIGIWAGHLFLLATCVGCTPAQVSEQSDSTPAGPSPDTTATSVLTGTIVRKEWTKTLESWNAGGSHYYVLDVGEDAVQQRTADEGVILIPTKNVSESSLQQHVGKQVQVKGEYFAGEPIQLSDEDFESQRPLGFTDDDLRGAGFKVFSMKPDN